MPFTEVFGILVHGINGTFVIPGIALALLIVSFFTKVRGAIKWAVIVFVLVVAQGQIGFLGHEFPLAGALHGLNALALFGVALYTGRRLRTAARSGVTAAEERVAAPVCMSEAGSEGSMAARPSAAPGTCLCWQPWRSWRRWRGCGRPAGCPGRIR